MCLFYLITEKLRLSTIFLLLPPDPEAEVAPTVRLLVSSVSAVLPVGVDGADYPQRDAVDQPGDAEAAQRSVGRDRGPGGPCWLLGA